MRNWCEFGVCGCIAEQSKAAPEPREPLSKGRGRVILTEWGIIWGTAWEGLKRRQGPPDGSQRLRRDLSCP